MKNIFISFGDDKYKKSLDLLKETSKEIGRVDEFIGYTKEWLDTTEFYKKNRFILSQPRGSGFWLWKSYIIKQTLETLDDGDVVIYSDAGLKVIDDLTPLFNLGREKGLLIFKLPEGDVPQFYHRAARWTKKDCFILMNADTQKYWDAQMSNGAVSVWQKNEFNMNLLDEWLQHGRNPQIITDSKSVFGVDDINFRDHRHDQSILSILRVKYDIELFRDPTQYGVYEKDIFPNSDYNQLFHHHRNFKH